MRTDSHQARLVLFFFRVFIGSEDLYTPTVNLPLLLGGGCIFPQLCCTLCFYVFCFVLSKFQRCFFSKKGFCLWSSGKRGKLMWWLKSLIGGRSMFQWNFHCYHTSSIYLSAALFHLKVLDMDGSGTINFEEFLHGTLRTGEWMDGFGWMVQDDNFH